MCRTASISSMTKRHTSCSICLGASCQVYILVITCCSSIRKVIVRLMSSEMELDNNRLQGTDRIPTVSLLMLQLATVETFCNARSFPDDIHSLTGRYFNPCGLKGGPN